jgi:hypothetical protein
MRELYSKEITDPSLKELKEFAGWYNEKVGNYPIIVGGWAVYINDNFDEEAKSLVKMGNLERIRELLEEG